MSHAARKYSSWDEAHSDGGRSGGRISILVVMTTLDDYGAIVSAMLSRSLDLIQTMARPLFNSSLTRGVQCVSCVRIVARSSTIDSIVFRFTYAMISEKVEVCQTTTLERQLPHTIGFFVELASEQGTCLFHPRPKSLHRFSVSLRCLTRGDASLMRSRNPINTFRVRLQRKHLANRPFGSSDEGRFAHFVS